LVNPEFGSVQTLSPHFEGACGVSKSQGEKKGKAIAALDHFGKLKTEDIPLPLTQIIESAYGSDVAKQDLIVPVKTAAEAPN
jgi:hypothetical protein